MNAKNGQTKVSLFVYVALLLYSFYWIFSAMTPFLEGDDAFILGGVVNLAKGFDAPYLYWYDNQPLYYVFLKHMITLLKLPLVYLPLVANIVSISCFLIVILCIYYGVKRIVSEKFAVSLIIACLLIHELLISGAYPNTSIFALAFLCLAFYCLVGFNSSPVFFIAASAFMALSFYARNDALFMAPCFLLAVYFRAKRLSIVALCASLILLIGGFFVKLTGLNIINALRHVTITFRGCRTPLHQTVLNLLSAMPLSIALLGVLGFAGLIASRRRRALSIFAVGFLPLFLFYLPVLITPKYILYICPFIAWMAVEGWITLGGILPRLMSRLVRAAIIILLAGQFLLKGDIFRLNNLFPNMFDFGRGLASYTHDGPRPLTGIAFFPQWFKGRFSSIKSGDYPLLSVARGHDRIYWITNYLYAGIVFFRLSLEADKKIQDPIGLQLENWRKQAFLMPDGSRVVSVFKGPDSPEGMEKELTNIEKGRKADFINIVLK